MKNCYIVDGYGFDEELNINFGKEFYMGFDKDEAQRIYNILINKIEPEYSKLVENKVYDGFYMNGSDLEESDADN